MLDGSVSITAAMLLGVCSYEHDIVVAIAGSPSLALGQFSTSPTVTGNVWVRSSSVPLIGSGRVGVVGAAGVAGAAGSVASGSAGSPLGSPPGSPAGSSAAMHRSCVHGTSMKSRMEQSAGSNPAWPACTIICEASSPPHMINALGTPVGAVSGSTVIMPEPHRPFRYRAAVRPSASDSSGASANASS